MIRRTTIELDDDLLVRAQRALGTPTMRATVEEALRRVAAEGEDESERRQRRQLEYLGELQSMVDLDVLTSDEMWR